MLDQLARSVSTHALLRALDHYVRNSAETSAQQRELGRRLSAAVISRPRAIVEVCRDARLALRDPALAAQLCQHALKYADTATRTAICAYAGSAGLSLPEHPPAPPAARGPYLTAAQSTALMRLRAFGDLFFHPAPAGPLAPRLIPLVVGPSGSGKNHLVRAFARELSCPVLRLTVGDWVVQGARRTGTLERLREWLDAHPKSILHLDELDKFKLHDDAWSHAVHGEVFAVLDRDISPSPEAEKPWTAAHTEKLQRSVCIVASGTWQEMWTTRRPGTLGFQAGATAPREAETDLGQRIRQTHLISEELLNRFNDRWLVLEPYTAGDFARLAAELGLPPGTLDPAAAVRSGLNFRYAENAYTEALLAKRLNVSDTCFPPTNPGLGAAALPRSEQ
jgi:hypothetical protein